MKLTIGMAHHEDFDGVFFTVQALALYQELGDVEILVIDNSPNTPSGKDVKNLVEGWMANGPGRARYIPLADAVGTSVPRDRVFREATGEIVLCIDCHVLLWPGAIRRLREWFAANPNSKDLVSGPLMFDDLQQFTTHFDDLWRGEMWGTWGQAWCCKCGEGTFAALNAPPTAPGQPGETSGGETRYRNLGWPQREITACEKCGVGLSVLPWPGHEAKLTEAGHHRLGSSIDDEPFEIPGNGLGLFACRKDAWPGFHPEARGFGGEELYIHEKIRRQGGRNWCLPFLRWSHRFGRPGGVKYPLSKYAKVRNYALEFLELGWDLAPIKEHIKLPEPEWEHLLADPTKHVRAIGETPAFNPNQAYGRSQPPANTSLDGIFDWCKSVPRDLDQHLPKLRELAAKCDHVTELSKRRESTVGLLAGRPKTMLSYQTEFDELYPKLQAATQLDADTERSIAETGGKSNRVIDAFTVHLGADSLAIDPIAPTDLLFIDTVMHGDRLFSELSKHGSQVRKWIVLTGTHNFWINAEGGGRGLMSGLHQWIGDNPEWHMVYRNPNEYGLTVVSRDPKEESIEEGPGTELHLILEKLDINPGEKCDCRKKMLQMDEWGVDGCRVNRDTIVKWMSDGAPNWGWSAKLKAAALAVMTGLAFKIDWSDPFPGMIDESIRNAEVKQEKRKAAA